MFEPGPDSKNSRIRRQDVVGSEDLAEPSFQFFRLGGVLLTGDLDTRLEFPIGPLRVQFFVGTVAASSDTTIGTRTTRFRDDIGIEEIHLFNRNPSPADGAVWYAVVPGGRLEVRRRSSCWWVAICSNRRIG